MTTCRGMLFDYPYIIIYNITYGAPTKWVFRKDFGWHLKLNRNIILLLSSSTSVLFISFVFCFKVGQPDCRSKYSSKVNLNLDNTILNMQKNIWMRILIYGRGSRSQ